MFSHLQTQWLIAIDSPTEEQRSDTAKPTRIDERRRP
jgi:hypothetical protein